MDNGIIKTLVFIVLASIFIVIVQTDSFECYECSIDYEKADTLKKAQEECKSMSTVVQCNGSCITVTLNTSIDHKFHSYRKGCHSSPCTDACFVQGQLEKCNKCCTGNHCNAETTDVTPTTGSQTPKATASMFGMSFILTTFGIIIALHCYSFCNYYT